MDFLFSLLELTVVLKPVKSERTVMYSAAYLTEPRTTSLRLASGGSAYSYKCLAVQHSLERLERKGKCFIRGEKKTPLWKCYICFSVYKICTILY